MTDSELIEEFISVERTAGGVELLVRTIDWEGRPYDPVSKWEEGMSLPASASEMDIQEASFKLLENPSFFKRCIECAERNPLGWMHDNDICQRCAQESHGVVY